MARSKRAQILMEPEEYRRLEELSRLRGDSVAELIRAAVREVYFANRETRREAVRAIASMAVDVGDWDEMEAEILDGYDARLP